jgi:hypothetical protein
MSFIFFPKPSHRPDGYGAGFSNYEKAVALLATSRQEDNDSLYRAVRPEAMMTGICLDGGEPFLQPFTELHHRECKGISIAAAQQFSSVRIISPMHSALLYSAAQAWPTRWEDFSLS